jgi:hypothetical protein
VDHARHAIGDVPQVRRQDRVVAPPLRRRKAACGCGRSPGTVPGGGVRSESTLAPAAFRLLPTTSASTRAGRPNKPWRRLAGGSARTFRPPAVRTPTRSSGFDAICTITSPAIAAVRLGTNGCKRFAPTSAPAGRRYNTNTPHRIQPRAIVPTHSSSNHVSPFQVHSKA